MSQIWSKVGQLGEHFIWLCLPGTHIFLLLTFIQFAHMITSRNHFTKQTWPVCWVYSFYRLDPFHEGSTSVHCAAHAHTTHLTLLCSCRFSWRMNTWSACDHETEQEFAQELSRFLSKNAQIFRQVHKGSMFNSTEKKLCDEFCKHQVNANKDQSDPQSSFKKKSLTLPHEGCTMVAPMLRRLTRHNTSKESW